MKTSFLPLVTIITTILSLNSCSRQTTIPVKPVYLSDFTICNTDSLFPKPEINLLHTHNIVEFFTPTHEITETFNSFETNNIRVKDDKLFAKQKDFILDLAPLPENTFAFPLPGAKVISPYGTRRGRNHTGIDLKTKANDTIVAAFSGIVRLSKRVNGYGNVIVIRHYNGLETVYSHNSKNFVQAGDRVSAKSPIGLTGRTGRATTEHLHFETRIDGEHFDPNLIIDFNQHRLLQKCIVFTLTGKGTFRIKKF